ncbi:FecR/PupR family sigma factor regulator [Nitrosovibrio sp. Nv4]|uniref:FecR/PupR family sigma factor regulator n=1 Tax=Nitrosovibrio sp. Nv4 TaxID=1945880 RepID=UPI000BD1964D|nr:DUF4880 domain-containing protein [Nitrosovibrio sp. Nv4]SOD42128.1 transmembrane sensor [Nitrosovibrio sp. Nv4]
MQREDIVWQTAVEWVIRGHESLSPADMKELIDWLKEDPANQAAYEEASRLWLLTGLVPPSVPPSDN